MQSHRSPSGREEHRRYHALDGLRAAMMLLGVPWHAAGTFNAGIFHWCRFASHGFRMQVFFVMAGFFAHLLYRRLGPSGFIANRGKRVLLPFLLAMVVVVPPIIVLTGYGYTRSWSRALDYLLSGEFRGRIGVAHLWFLYYLMIFYGVAVALVGLGRWKRWAARGERVHQWFRGLLQSPWKPLLLLLPVFTALSFSGHWGVIEPAGRRLAPTPRALFYYSVFFAFGWMLFRNADLLQNISRHMKRYLPTAAVAGLAALALLRVDYRMGGGPEYLWLKIPFDFLYALYSWCMVFALIGLFFRYLDRHNHVARYLADSAYWVYLMHLPLVMYLQFVFTPHASLAQELLHFLAINVITLAAVYLTYHYFVRYTVIGSLLHKTPARPGRRQAAAA